ncbi:MAG: hypothetical protein WBZ36_25485 [Candidatus Nitrosopolaris sp.]
MKIFIAILEKNLLCNNFTRNPKNTLAALGLPLLLATIMLTSQSASANWIERCFGEPEWNHAIIQSSNPDCFPRRTYAYFDGCIYYGYTYEWNTTASVRGIIARMPV